jgi:hypothetical protein
MNKLTAAKEIFINGVIKEKMSKKKISRPRVAKIPKDQRSKFAFTLVKLIIMRSVLVVICGLLTAFYVTLKKYY